MAIEKKKIVYNSLTGMFEVSLDVSGMADTADIVATYIPLSQKGIANGVVPLDAGGKISAAFLPNSVMELQGFYNASTNTPTLADGVGNPGDVYEIDVAGTVDLGSGNLNLKVGDWVVYAADGKWHKSINSNEVVSVNGLTGAVTLTTSNINEGSNLYYTTARFDSAFASKTTDNLSEGITNLYYTNARFDSRLATKSTTDLAEGSNLYYTQSRFDTALAAKDTDDLSEGISNLYFTNSRAKAAAVADSISDGVTDVAPSQNAVFDALATKEPSIPAGTTSQYYRGDKTFQTLDKNAVGLSNVTNDSQLKRAANDFNTFTEKTTPAADDVLLMEDSADSGNKKYIKYSNLVASTGAPSWQTLPSVAAGTWVKAVTTNPSYGSAIAKNYGMYRRVGNNLEIEWDFRQGSAGSAGSGAYLFDIFAVFGLTIDTTRKAGSTAVVNPADFDSLVGEFKGFNNDTGQRFEGGVYVYDSNKLKVGYLFTINSTGVGGYNTWGSGSGAFSAANLTINVRISVPIVGW